METANLTLLELLLASQGESEGQIKIYKNRQEMLLYFTAKVKSQMPLLDFIDKCAASSDSKERIQIVQPFFEWIPSLQNFKNQFKKHNPASAGHLQKAQLAFNNGDYAEALQICGKAIAYALPQSSDLASAYYWRSLILYQLNDPVSALCDLDLALSTNDFPRNNEKSISNLRATFNKAIDDACLRVEGGEEVENSNVSKTKRQTFVDDLFTLKSPNEMAPALEDFVEIKYDSIKGRHLVTTKDVPIGTALLIEKPIVTMLDGTLKLNTTHCHHCLKKNFRRIPCPNCVFAFFCNEECLNEAAIYHQYECPCLPDLHGILIEGVTENFYLAFKFLCILGPQKLHEIFKSRAKKIGVIDQSSISGCDPQSGIYDSESYLPIFNLAPINEPQEILFPLLALMLTSILEENCPAFFEFENINSKSKSEFREFIAETFLNNFERFWKNVFNLGVVTEYEESNGFTFDGQRSSPPSFEFQQFASRIFVTGSLVNHSCDPNVKLFSKLTFGIGVLISLRPLKKGEELLISYGPLFYADPKIERQNQLERCYNFKCACVACANDWLEDVENFGLEITDFCCPDCTSKMGHDMKGREIQKLVLNVKNNFQCPRCRVQYDEEEILNKFTQIKKAAVHSRHLLENDNPLQAQESFRSILEYFENNIVHPSFDLVMSQELFCEAIYKIIHFTE